MRNDLQRRIEKDAEYAALAAVFPKPTPEVLARRERDARQQREYEVAVALRKKWQRLMGRLPNRSKLQIAMPPIGREGKLDPYSKEWRENDWYTPIYPELYDEGGSDTKGLLSMRESHQKGHPEFKNRGNRAVIGCASCQSAVYRRKRRYEMKRDIVSWLDARCYLCLSRDVPDFAFEIVRVWGGHQRAGRLLHHSAADIESEIRDNYVLVCPTCYHDKGRKAVYEKAQKRNPGFARPPARQGRHPRIR